MANADFTNRSSSAAATVQLPTAIPRLADFRFSGNARLISPDVLTGTLRISEFVLLAALGFAIALSYVPHADISASYLYPCAGVGAALAAVGIMELMGLYRTRTISKTVFQIPSALTAWTIAIASFVAGVFFFKAADDISRVWLLAWFVAGAVALIASRSTVAYLSRRWAREGRLNKRAVVYGAGPEAEALLQALEQNPDTDIRICGVFDNRMDSRSKKSAAGYPKLGNLNDLVDLVRSTRIDMVILSMPLAAEKRLVEILDTLAVLPVDIRLVGAASELRFNRRAYSYIGNVAMLDLLDKPISDWGNVAKSLFDRSVGLAAMILLAPLMALIALAIRLDSKGPVLFRQKRYGFNNELIEVFKFRSMYVDMSDAQAAKLVTKDDPRVTPVGRFIRKTSIDELPQLFNVLAGNLSLVGPRPHAIQAKAADKLYDVAVTNYFARHKVKPGITGWAQVNGWRGETDTEEKIRRRVEHDLYYIDNWSLFFDMYILAKTPFALLKTENAY